MTSFVAYMYKEKLSGGMVKSYLAAVRHTQIALGLGDAHMGEMPQLEYVVKGVKKMPTDRPTRPLLPRALEILCRLKSMWQNWPNCRDASMLWAAATMCFFGFLRAGEVVVPSEGGFDPSSHLAYGDVRANNLSTPQFLEVWIKASKTDPFRHGVSVYLGRTTGELCPVAWFSGECGVAPSSLSQMAGSSPESVLCQQCGQH